MASVVAHPLVGQPSSRVLPVLAVLYLAVVAVRVHEVLPYLPYTRPALTLGVACVIALLATPGKTPRALIMNERLMAVLVGFFGWAVLTGPVSLWPTHAISTALSTFPPLLLMVYLVLSCERTERNREFLVTGFLIAGTLHGAMLLLLRPLLGGARLSSVSSLDPNDLASLMVICMPFALARALGSTGKKRLLALASLAIFLTVVALTGSRGGFLALLVSGAAYLTITRGARRASIFGALAVALVLMWFLAPESFRDRIRSIGDTSEDYNVTDYNGREQIWKRARGYIAEHPVTGVGMDNFPVAEGNYLAEAGSHGKWSTTHNAYLQVASEMGLVGAAFFIGVLGIGFRAAWWLGRAPSKDGGAGGPQPEFFAALSGFAAGAYFLSHAYFVPMYAVVVLAIFAQRVREAQQWTPAIAGPAPRTLPRGRGFRSMRTAHIRPR